MQIGDYKLAAEYYEFAVNLNPKFIEARQDLRQAIEQKENRTIKVSLTEV